MKIKLARAILQASQERESSWEAWEAWEALGAGILPVPGTYKKSLKECCEVAANCQQIPDQEVWLVFALLYHCWNDALDWAKKVIEDCENK